MVNTAQDWVILGEQEPWYGVLTQPEYLRENITDETIARFYASGQHDVSWIFDTILTVNPSFKPNVAFDFGSGLGRLAFAMAKRAIQVYGIDISPGMRTEATRQAAARGIENFQAVETAPEDVKADWLNSYIVFQHIAPRTGLAVLEGLLAKLNDKAMVSVHLTFATDQRQPNNLMRDLGAWRFDGETLTVLSDREHAPGTMSMYDYDMNKVLFMLIRNGFGKIHLTHTDHGGSHGFVICSQRE
jgi:SAM-dependent methyltransferase